MSADASVTFEWADGEHTFRLAYGQIRELQEKTGVGPAKLYERLCDGSWMLEDILETLRLGLIGGEPKTEPLKHKQLVWRYVGERPLIESVEPAAKVLYSLLSGDKDDPLPKRDREKTTTEAMTTAPDASASPESTDKVPQSE